MIWLLAVAAVLLLGVAITVLFGPPYLPTMNRQVQAALELLDLKPGQTMLELGCGDGRVLVAAAKQGIKCVGIELSPVLAAIAWLRTRRYGKQVRVICGNYFYVKWPDVDGIFTFMIDRQMGRLDTKIKQIGSPIKLASFAFKIPGKKAAKQKNGVFLYQY